MLELASDHLSGWGPVLAQSGGGLVYAGIGLDDCIRRLCGQVYLATPYSREVVDEHGEWDAFLSGRMDMLAGQWVGNLATAGITSVSPIVLACSAICMDVKRQIDPLDTAFWTSWCAPLLAASASVVVPPIEGRWRSSGVLHEVEWAIAHNMPVYLLEEGAKP